MQQLSQIPVSPLAFGAIGDAYGFCFEFAEAAHIHANNCLAYIQHPEFADVKPGAYSDDTQMQLALAELMVSELPWTKQNIASSFVSTFKRDPRPGYAKRFYSLLDQIADGDELLAKIVPSSDRNGAAMRSPIIGLYPDESRVVESAQIQAAVTHDTPGGVDSSVAAALISHFFVYQLGEKQELPKYLKSRLPNHDWEQRWSGSVPCHGMSTVFAALTAILNTDSLGKLLEATIEYTGDVDSVATIALACASSSSSFQRDLPNVLIDDFEKSKFGMQYLIATDCKLLEKLKITR
ncbi:ADP-ribosylglycohydrolase family protein [Mariniblastus sp.]|nr:ADP-ribosylglycohydrolase family protein [Mariniblastus sp.]